MNCLFRLMGCFPKDPMGKHMLPFLTLLPPYEVDGISLFYNLGDQVSEKYIEEL